MMGPMCGICGVFQPEANLPVERALLTAMTGELAHRGPDDEGFHVSGPTGLGHRRLSIVDLGGGHQPMASADGRVWTVFNGEIYNHEALRRELESRGRRYRTRSDTECILHLYDELGPAFVERLEGMFALAVWDEPRRRLVLARDRLGIKPLYYAWSAGRLAFASEIKSLLHVPWLSLDIDPEALDGYLALQYVPAPRTIFAAVRKLPAGHRLVAEGTTLSVAPYWRIEPEPAPRSFEEGCAAFRERFERAVGDRLMSDVPLGAFLSGGIDSSLVVALMARQMDRPVQAFSIGFDTAGWHSELPFAERAARHLGAEHHTHLVRSVDMQSLLPRVARQLDEPLADVAAIPTYLLSRFAREHVTVCLTGEGADELFAGYRRHTVEAAALALSGVPAALRRPLAALAARLVPRGLRRSALAVGLDGVERYLYLRSVLHAADRHALLRPELAERIDPEQLTRRIEAHFGGRYGLNDVLRADTQEWLPEDLLMKVDKMSMLTSLEARVPFLDHRVVELVAGFPASWKHARGRGKRLLKSVALELLPREIVERPKHGFMPPIARWLGGELRPFAENMLLDPQARFTGYLRPEVVAERHRRFLAGDARESLPLWLLLCFEVWLRELPRRPATG